MSAESKFDRYIRENNSNLECTEHTTNGRIYYSKKLERKLKKLGLITDLLNLDRYLSKLPKIQAIPAAKLFFFQISDKLAIEMKLETRITYWLSYRDDQWLLDITCTASTRRICNYEYLADPELVCTIHVPATNAILDNLKRYYSNLYDPRFETKVSDAVTLHHPYVDSLASQYFSIETYKLHCEHFIHWVMPSDNHNQITNCRILENFLDEYKTKNTAIGIPLICIETMNPKKYNIFNTIHFVLRNLKVICKLKSIRKITNINSPIAKDNPKGYFAA